MKFDWEKIKKELPESPSRLEPGDVSRLSLERFISGNNPIRRIESRGLLHLSGAGVKGNAASVDGIALALTRFQKLVLATGMSISGLTSIRGSAPTDILNQTRLNLDGSPNPGSISLSLTPALAVEKEISPDNQLGMFGEEDTRLIDSSMLLTLQLLEAGKAISSGDVGSDEFLSQLSPLGPRVASSLKGFAAALFEFEFAPTVSWDQPGRQRVTSKLEVYDLFSISDSIHASELELEPTEIRGELKTVSEISAWQILSTDNQLIKVNASQIPKSETSRLSTGMKISVQVQVTETIGPANESKLHYVATSFSILGRSAE